MSTRPPPPVSDADATWLPVPLAARRSEQPYERVLNWAHAGKVRKTEGEALVRVSARNRNGRAWTATRQVEAILVCWEDVCALTDPQPGESPWLPLVEAALRSEISYETWYWWTTQKKCAPLGRKLHADRRLSRCEDGRFRKTLHITEKDYATITERLNAPLRDRFVDADGEWLSPTAAGKEFYLPNWKNPRASLNQLRLRRVAKLGRVLRARKGSYLDQQGRWVRRRCYHVDDLAALYPRRGPKALQKLRAEEPEGAALSTPLQQVGSAEPCSARVVLQGEKAPVIVNESEKWSKPDSPTEWARIFGVHYNTMIDWLKTQKVKNKQISPRRYCIDVEELPLCPPE